MRRAWCRLLALSGGATRGSSLVRIGGRLCGNYHIEKMYKMQFLETESATILSTSSVSEGRNSIKILLVSRKASAFSHSLEATRTSAVKLGRNQRGPSF
jgi:hypothetical protein